MRTNRLDYTEFIQLVKKNGLYGEYPLKGSYYISPSGMKYLEKIQHKWRDLLSLSPTGIPTMVSETDMTKEIDQFNMDKKSLFKSENNYFKGTSEAVLYSSNYFKNKCKRYKNLPFSVLGQNRVYRNEDRSQPFVRHTEIYGFTEVHEVHDNCIDSNKRIGEILDMYELLMNSLRIPHIILERPVHDRFNGADATFAIDTIIGHKRLQIATVHNLGNNWSKLYSIKYIKDSVEQYPVQFCYGHSERVLFSMLYFNYDETQNKLKLPVALRLIEALFIDCPVTNIDYVDIHLSVHYNDYKTKLVQAKWRDSILLIFNDTEYVRIVDRNSEQYIKKQYVSAYHLKKTCDTSFKNSFEIGEMYKLPYTTDLLKEDVWGSTLSKRYIYRGPTF